MTSRSSHITAPGGLVIRLGRLLTALVADKDRRLRETIASAVTRARRHHDLESITRWHARHDPASKRRVE
ncbi:MAG TPA: hypothetical protein VMT72_16180 [Pseudolabrys sp.]|nr:hypothetical protein [Pseudolabrys sp.]